MERTRKAQKRAAKRTRKVRFDDESAAVFVRTAQRGKCSGGGAGAQQKSGTPRNGVERRAKGG